MFCDISCQIILYEDDVANWFTPRHKWCIMLINNNLSKLIYNL